MQCLSPSCLWQCFSPILPSLTFWSQSICQNCKVFVKIFNDSDKIVVASLKCSDNDSCDCNNQRSCERTSESQLGLVIIQLPIRVLIYWHICVCPYISRHISRVQAKAGGWAATQSLVALLPSYSPPPPNAAWATALSDWLPVRRTPTDPQSVQRQILRRDTFLRKHRDTRRRKRKKEKKEKEQKEVVVVTCDKWEYLLHTGIYLFYSSSLSFN